MHRLFAVVAVALCALMVGRVVAEEDGAATGEVRGMVTAYEDGAPVAGVNIRLMRAGRGAAPDTLGTTTDTSGVFVIRRAPEGIYRLEASEVAHRTEVRRGLRVRAGQALRRDIVLRSRVLALDEIVVTPGRYSVLTDDPAVPRTLSRQEFMAMPYIGEDIYRAVARLPGVTGSDFSARFTVRGGDYDQILVTLDGLELYEPFHLKDLGGGVMSIVNAEVIEGVDMMTGGFPADYGDRMSAVLEMGSRSPEAGALTSAGLGIMQARATTEGATERFGWLASARMGYIDKALELFGTDRTFSPDYYDGFVKLTFDGSDRHRFALHALGALDKLRSTDDDYDRFNSEYGNGYVWLTWDATPGSGTHVRTMVHFGDAAHRRESVSFDNQGDVTQVVDDIRYSTRYGVKVDGKAQAGKRHVLRLGAEAVRGQTEYDFFKRQRISGQGYAVTQTLMRPGCWDLGVYASDKWRLFAPLTADVGLRYDRQSHTDDSQVSPRAGLALALGEKTMFRVAWGRYYQSHDVRELDVQDGATALQQASLAAHYIAGVERRLGVGMVARVEGYHKDLRHIRNRFENLDDDTDFLPELEGDRIHLFPEKGTARGIEVFLKRDAGGLFNWWVNYAWTTVHETHRTDMGYSALRGLEVPRRFDQRHSFSVDIIFRPRSNWRLGLGWEIRGGWPYTPREPTVEDRPGGGQTSAVVYGAFFSKRYPLYHRLDMKITHWYDYGRWRLRAALGVTNVYNRLNVRRYTYTYTQARQAGEHRRLVGVAEGWLPSLPFINFGAEF